MPSMGDTDTVEKRDLVKKKTFPQILKYQRELRGWSQAKMSEEIGATPNRISSWERGTALPGAYFREKLCRCLNMDAQELGLLTSDVEVLDEARDETQLAPVFSSLVDVRDEEPIFPDHQSSPENLPHHLKERKRLPRISVSLALGAVLLLIAGWIMPSYGVFNGILNPNQVNPNQVNPYPPYTGRIVLQDALRDQSSGVNWQEGVNDQQASCVFKEGGYVAFQPVSGRFHGCLAQKTDYTNFTYEVRMTIQQGEFGGIIFRSEDSIDAHYYIFRVHTDGSYWLYRFVDRDIEHSTLLDTGTASTYVKGLNKTNRLSVVAQGNLLTLYVNNREVTSLQDAGYTRGQIGVLAGSINQGPAQALFQDVKVWSQ